MKVLLITGAGHSGSTLLQRVLASDERVCAVGEFRRLWSWGVRRNQPCGCGAAFHDCAFWQDVGREAFGGWEAVDAAAERDAQERLLQAKYVPLLRAGRVPGTRRADLARFNESRRRLFEAIVQVSGAEVVVDTSKSGPYTALVARVPGLDVHAVHLLRDSRAFAYSYVRRRSRKGWKPIPGSTGFRGRFHIANMTARWLIRQGGVELAWSGSRRATRVRYEDFARDPEAVRQRVLRAAGLEPGPGAGSASFAVGTAHVLAGNAVRNATGLVTVTPDDEWREGLGAARTAMVTAMTWPFLLKYGYLGVRRRAT
jgi:hypothetical protein